MHTTSPFEKLAASAFNAALALALSLPIALLSDFSVGWRFSVVAIFFLMQVFDTHQHVAFRCLGMRAVGTHWARRYSPNQQALYSIL